ncbi:hypothetical protein Agub_g1720, partial [Astrephomene gubernaculifera]
GFLHGSGFAALTGQLQSCAGSNTSLSCQLNPAMQVARPSEVVLQTCIGRGSMGSVFKGTWRGEAVAVKVLKHSATGPDEEQAKRIEQEAALGICLDHPNIVATYAAFTTVSAVPGPQLPTSRQASMHSQGQLHIPCSRTTPFGFSPGLSAAPLIQVEQLDLTHGSQADTRASAFNNTGGSTSFSRAPSTFSRWSPGVFPDEPLPGSPISPRGTAIAAAAAMSGWPTAAAAAAAAVPPPPHPVAATTGSSRCGSFASIAAGHSYS